MCMNKTGQYGEVVDEVEEIAGNIASNTRLSEKQATALIMRGS